MELDGSRTSGQVLPFHHHFVRYSASYFYPLRRFILLSATALHTFVRYGVSYFCPLRRFILLSATARHTVVLYGASYFCPLRCFILLSATTRHTSALQEQDFYSPLCSFRQTDEDSNALRKAPLNLVMLCSLSWKSSSHQRNTIGIFMESSQCFLSKVQILSTGVARSTLTY